MALLTAPSVLDDGALTSLVLPARRYGISEMRKQSSVQPGILWTRPDDLKATRDTPRHHRRRDDGGRDRHGIDVDPSVFRPDADHMEWQIESSFRGFSDMTPARAIGSGHGSHIASLIGWKPDHIPVSRTDADLIRAEVFSDAGTGPLAMSEQALLWVVAQASTTVSTS